MSRNAFFTLGLVLMFSLGLNAEPILLVQQSIQLKSSSPLELRLQKILHPQTKNQIKAEAKPLAEGREPLPVLEGWIHPKKRKPSLRERLKML